MFSEHSSVVQGIRNDAGARGKRAVAKDVKQIEQVIEHNQAKQAGCLVKTESSHSANLHFSELG